MICDGCKKCWYWQLFDCAYKNGSYACHYCFYNGVSRGELIDGKCPHQVKKLPPKLLHKFWMSTNPFKGGRL